MESSLNDVTQVGGGGLSFCEIILEGISKSHLSVTKGVQKSSTAFMDDPYENY